MDSDTKQPPRSPETPNALNALKDSNNNPLFPNSPLSIPKSAPGAGTALPPYFYSLDVHTHLDVAGCRAIVNLEPGDGFGTSSLYSMGVHPWKAAEPDVDSRLALMEQNLNLYAYNSLQPPCTVGADVCHPGCSPVIVAVGECGLDLRKGPDLQLQLPVFKRQLEMAEKYRLPVILHAVGANHILLNLKKHLRPQVPWIFHGFRGNPAQARQLLDAGIHLSLGRRFNPSTIALPTVRFLRESDNMPGTLATDTQP